MTNRAEQNKQELIDRVAERVNQRLDKDRAKLAEQFARLLYSNIPPDDIKEESADNLYGAALSLLNFADQRFGSTTRGSRSKAGARPTPSSRSTPTTCRSWSIR
jgi:glutamate dehydrogenase